MQKKHNIFYISLKNLLRKPFRTVAIALPIALVITLFIFALSLSLRVREGLERSINRLGGDVMIVPAGALVAAQQFLIESKRSTFYMERTVLDKIKGLPEVDKLTHHIYLTPLYGICCGVSEAQVIAFNPEVDFVVSSWLKEATGKELEKGQTFVGSTAYAEWELLKMGEGGLIFGKKYKVAGVLEPTGTVFDNSIFIREDDMMAAIEKGLTDIDPKRISVIFVKLKEGYKPEDFARIVEEGFLEVDAVPRGEIGRGLRDTLSDMVKIFSIGGFITVVLTLLMIGAFFSAIVNERMREAGIIRALGAKKIHLFKIFILEALMVGVLGSLFGLLLGNILDFIFGGTLSIVTPSMKIGMGGAFKINSIALIVGPLICIAGALLPVVRVSNMEPYEAIRRGE